MSRRYRSSDPAALSHIESLHYVPITAVDPGGHLTYGDWRDTEAEAQSCRECWGRGERRTHGLYREIRERCIHCYGTGRVRAIPLTVIEIATGSDYSGNLVEVSNFRMLKREFPWLVELSGGYGTRGLAYLGKRKNQNPALIEAIDSLTDYPIYSDDDHSELEWERAREAWSEDYGGRHDFRRALAAYFDEVYAPDEHDLDEIDDKRIDQLWYDCAERLMGGEDHLNESGESIYFPIRNVIDKIKRSWPGLDRPSYDGTRPSINDQLVAIASDATINTECDECGKAIPNNESSNVNKSHDPSCSLYEENSNAE